jgi:hypothetical protein
MPDLLFEVKKLNSNHKGHRKHGEEQRKTKDSPLRSP